ncbi:MAG: Tol-Pal system protein TolB [Sulfuricella sp.]|nr:Tol-Pal system protein TolB [Sulfuricella sp.]
MKRIFQAFLLSALIFPGALYALTIEIVGSGANQIPVSIVPFAAEKGLAQPLSEIVAADLQRSGLFKLIDPSRSRIQPSQPTEVVAPEWRALGAEAIVIGGVTPRPDGRLDVQFRLMDVVKNSQIAGFSYTVSSAEMRLTAHKIADIVYEKLTGDVGVFSTKIAYVLVSGKRYELQVADADGYNPHTILGSNEPISFPNWSPDGTRLAYTSFESKKPVVYVQSLLTGKRSVVAQFKGNNVTPAWSPDGQKLAIALSKDGHALQIYTINADGSGVKRLTYSNGSDSAPSFSPDGKSIVFTSDRGGSPQIYRIAADGGDAARLTFDGNYNTNARFAPDGKSFVFVHQIDGRITVQDMATWQIQVLTDGGKDDSPSFAPNGKMIIYASEIGGRGVLAAVSSDGRVKQRLTTTTGEVRHPAWGPLLKTQ